jgi:hypothetical protein
MAQAYLGGHTIIREWQLIPRNELYDEKIYEQKYGDSYTDKILEKEQEDLERATHLLALEFERFAMLGIELKSRGQSYESVFSLHRTYWKNIEKLANSIYQRNLKLRELKKRS